MYTMTVPSIKGVERRENLPENLPLGGVMGEWRRGNGRVEEG
jgi:hypothetical protein